MKACWKQEDCSKDGGSLKNWLVCVISITVILSVESLVSSMLVVLKYQQLDSQLQTTKAHLDEFIIDHEWIFDQEEYNYFDSNHTGVQEIGVLQRVKREDRGRRNRQTKRKRKRNKGELKFQTYCPTLILKFYKTLPVL